MSIAVKTTIANRVRAYRLAHPEATEVDIAKHFGIQPVLVQSALSKGDKRRLKPTAN